MKLAGLLRRERTNVTSVSTTTFNAPGIYYPPYGRTVIQLSGRGSPGNATTGGNYSGYNYYEYMTYVPASGGNYSGDNSYSYGTYVPAVPSSYAGTNPTTPGNATGVIQWSAYRTDMFQNSFFGTPYSYYFWSSSYPSGYGADYNLPSPSYNLPAQQSNAPSYFYNSAIYISYSYVQSFYNPATPGNAYYNPYSSAYTYYTYVGGNANYNPYYPGYNYYTGVPGNSNYNPIVPGNTAPSYNVVGISLPGGVSDTAAPVIGFITVAVDYSTAGTPISVPPGGYVSVKNI